MIVKRLFDCLPHQLAHFPKKDMLAAKEKGQWVTYSTEQVADTVNKLSAGLLQLANEGMTMMCVTHEMGFAREVADRVWFMDAGRILETNDPETFFRNPQHPRAQRGLVTRPAYTTFDVVARRMDTRGARSVTLLCLLMAARRRPG